jgi:hypothetical protein
VCKAKWAVIHIKQKQKKTMKKHMIEQLKTCVGESIRNILKYIMCFYTQTVVKYYFNNNEIIIKIKIKNHVFTYKNRLK